MASDIILQTTNLTKQFGGFTAVNNVNLSVKRGTVHALIGPNGAGKTTVFNLLTKTFPPTSGQIVYNGRDITSMQPYEVARIGITRSFQISAVFSRLSVRENVRIALQDKIGESYAFWRSGKSLSRLDDRVDELLELVDMSEHANEPAMLLPYGRKRALEIATTIALEPELLLLDEPMAGLSSLDIDRISNLIRRLSADRTILMVEHNLSVVANLSNTITVLTRGQILAEGNYAEVSSMPAVQEAYLGAGHDA